jgi:hypothetical protein
MYESLTIERIPDAKPLPPQTYLQARDIAYALDAAAIGYHRTRRQLTSIHGDADEALRNAVAVNNIPIYSRVSIDDAKRKTREAQHERAFAAFSKSGLLLSKYQIPLMLIAIGIALAVFIAGYLQFHLHGAWTFAWLLLVIGGACLVEMKIFDIQNPLLMEWQTFSLQEYGDRFMVPGFIIARAISIAKIAPAAEFSVECFGSDPLLVVRASLQLNALRLYIGYWDEKTLAAQ